MDNTFRILVRDSPFPRIGNVPLAIVGELDTYLKFDAISRHNHIGSWTLEIPVQHPQSKLLQPGCGIVVFREGSDEPMFSGQIRKLVRRWDDQEDAGTGTIVVSGVDDNAFLAERLAWTDPARDIHASGGVLNWKTDLAWKSVGELLYHLIKQNTQDLPDRQVPWMFVKPPQAGLFDDETAKVVRLKYDRVDELIELLSAAYSFSVRCVWHPDPVSVGGSNGQAGASGPGLLVTLGPVQDRTQSVRFSIDNGNLRGYTFTLLAPEATRLVIGTQNRTWKELERQDTFDEYGNKTGYTLNWADKSSPERWYGYFKNHGYDPAWWGNPDITPPESSNTLPWAQAGFTATEVEWGLTTERYKDRRDIPWQWTPHPTTPGWHMDPPLWSAQHREILDELEAFTIDNGPKAAISIDPVEQPRLRYHIHYSVGDYVGANIDGDERREQVTEVRLTATPSDGPLIKPLLGSYGSSETPYLYRSIRDLWARVNYLASREATSYPTDDVPRAEFVLQKVV
ncbi:Gp37-like protein [Nonomuraea jabiensis]|uniref:Gp37-like protein n=1 Tax=Nonomuraea jabiensis TaxID=882448 RepID=UPI003D718B4D